jgi:ribonuclease HI
MPQAKKAGALPRRKFHQLHTDAGVIAATGQAAGQAAIGVILKDPDGDEVHHMSTRIGRVNDHHVAEYRALIAGLRLARGHGVDSISVFLDSDLVRKHVKGESSVGKAYVDLCAEARSLVSEFEHIEISRVSSKENRDAHRLASRALSGLTRTVPGG